MIINTKWKNEGKKFPESIVRFEVDVFRFYFYTSNEVILNVTVLRDSILRFRYTSKGYFSDDFSYAVNLDNHYGFVKLEFTEHDDHFLIETEKLICRVDKKDCKTTIFDAKKNTILQDEIGFHWEENHEYGGKNVLMTKHTNEGESFYGLGDKATNLNLKGKRFQNWVTDQYAYAKDQDPLYKSIPFYTGLHNNISYGIFFDNTFRTQFDFSSERNNVTSFWADGGEMNYYFIYGPKMQRVVSLYTQLTGQPELPPLWALGYHQSKWSYAEEGKVKEIADKFRALQIPCDCIHLDIDYMDEFRCFTWNLEKFPEPKKMVSELSEQGFKTLVIIDPGIKKDHSYSVFKEGLENEYFCKRADGPLMKGKVWPGECYFPDYTNPKVREWWATLFKKLIEKEKISGVWNDMNEPAIMEVPSKTFPLDVRHNFDGHPCSHRKAHNVYGMQMSKATYEGIKKYIYPRRPFVITRAAYSGTQKYSSTWTGDNIATWEHLWLANVQMQRLSLSGFSFSGSDIGGFAEQPSGELYVRWIQLGTFHPLFRTHSSGHHGDQEPWSFGDEEMAIVKKFIELRYQLLPYLYTAFYQYVTSGDPILKSLVLFDQEDTQTHYNSEEFIFGSKILVCPIMAPSLLGKRAYIPKGKWYNYWTNEYVEGCRELWVECGFDKIPIFILEGSIIPRYPIQQYVGEKFFEEMYLDAYYKEGKEESSFYDDNQDGYDYIRDKYALRNFTLIGEKEELIITQYKLGEYTPTYKNFIITFVGLPFEVQKIELDRVEKIDLSRVFDKDKCQLKVNVEFSEIRLFSKK